MLDKAEKDSAARAPGTPDAAGEYRSHVGPAERYDLFSAVQFNLLTFLGLREHHYLLDVGCGSLRAGRLFIPYLQPGHYYGVEPEAWLVQQGIERELGADLVRLKRPVFSHDDRFTFSALGQRFDFLLAYSIFSHASQDQIRRCLSEARQVMQPGAIFAATFAEGPDDYQGDRWVLWATYTFERMRALVEEQGLVCVPIEWPNPDPNLQRWILIVHPGTEERIAHFGDASQLARLQGSLDFYKQRLAALEGHPYVRLGIQLNRGAKLLAYAGRRALRAVRNPKR